MRNFFLVFVILFLVLVPVSVTAQGTPKIVNKSGNATSWEVTFAEPMIIGETVNVAVKRSPLDMESIIKYGIILLFIYLISFCLFNLMREPRSSYLSNVSIFLLIVLLVVWIFFVNNFIHLIGNVIILFISSATIAIQSFTAWIKEKKGKYFVMLVATCFILWVLLNISQTYPYENLMKAITGWLNITP